jgi:cysteinyl-tRNA synthetase
MRIFNTLSRKIEDFRPMGKEVKVYACGPTVYHYAHIGNLRTYIFEDVLRRSLLFNGFKVKHVMNITDCGHLTSDADEGEDKMAKGAAREGKTVWEIAKFYENAFFSDCAALNIQKPEIKCKATEHIPEMIELIQKIEKNGYTYVSEGNVYFDVTKFSDYGKLSRMKIEGQEAGARVAVDEAKKNKLDFVLWFTKSKFGNQDMQWDSPWGRGFPGWHIECSAMSIKYLGEQFDIHCGGIDHIPIHHTNEIAQSEAATGKKPWVKYWMHGEFLVMDKEKMSKASGEFLRMQLLIDKGYDPIVYRYFCIGAHYRQQLRFSWEGLDGARNAFNRLKEKVLELRESKDDAEGDLVKTTEYEKEFENAVTDDLNMPTALSVMWSVVRDEDISSSEKLGLLFKFDNVLGLGIEGWKRESVEISDEVKRLLELRENARRNKLWKESDELRDRIKSLGFLVMDGADGQMVKRI